MQTVAIESTASRVPSWLWAASVIGVLWNTYGAYQYVGTFTPAGQAAMTAGMTASQAALYLSLPGWISVVFALGVFAAVPSQLGILAIVVLIAAALSWASQLAGKRGLLS